MLFFPIIQEDTVVREFKKNQVHVYRVHMSYTANEVDQQIDYTIRAKCLDDGKDTGLPAVELKFTNYRYEALDHVKRTPLTGGGQVSLGETGLPTNLKANIANSHFWYPLLAWFLPSKVTDGKFDAVQDLSPDARLDAKGTLVGDQYSMAGNVVGGPATMIPLNISWKVGKTGWLTSGKGDLTDTDGTLQFQISGR